MSSNFWNSCPLKKDSFPVDSCPLGQKGATKQSDGCEWFINDEQSCYCFWKYVRSQSDSEGEISPHTLAQIISLLQIPQTKLNKLYKACIEKMKDIEGLKDSLLKSE